MQRLKVAAAILLFFLISSLSFTQITVGKCEAWMLVDGNGHFIAGENIDKKWPLASLTKMMNAYTMLDKVKNKTVGLNDTVTVDQDSARTGGSSARLWTGEKLSVYELLKGMIIPSGNDAAVAMANYVSKNDVDAYVADMNSNAKKLGMTSSTFCTPDGLPPNMTKKGMDISTAKDMAILATELTKSTTYLSVSKLKTTTIHRGQVRLNSSNSLLGKVYGLDGMKTGHHDEALYNMIVTAKRGNQRLTAIVLGAPTVGYRNLDSKQIITQGFSQIETKEIGKTDDNIATVKVANGSKRQLDLVLGKDSDIVILKGEENMIKKEAEIVSKIKAPIQQGEQLGFLKVTYQGKLIEKVPLVSNVDIKRISKVHEFLRIATFGIL